MASGSSGRGNSATKGFDFASDDILCSYDDYANRDSSSNGNHADPDFHKSRMARTSMFPTTAYNPPEESLSQDVIVTVEKSMKKYADNLMRFLEGISSRLSQLELYCYNLDKSIGEMKSDLNRDHAEQDSRLKSLEKHLQEVHRSVQILRDKQELADTQKELAKLQLAQKESSSSSHSQSNEERSSPTTDPKKTDNASDATNQQLALALPHQIPPQQQPAAPPTQPPAQNVTQAPQQPPYYMPPTPLPNPAVAQHPQNQYLHSDQQYRTPQIVAPQPAPSQVTPSPAVQQFSHYQQPQQHPQPQQPQQQQQWAQQVQPSQAPPMQSQVRPPSPSVYPPYQPNQATNQSPSETLPNSMTMQMPYSGVPPPGSSRDAMTYGYGGAGRTVPQQPPPQQMKGSFPAQPGEMYGPTGNLSALPPPSSAYMMYDGEGGRTHHPPQPPSHFAQPGYPPTSASLQNPPGHNLMVRNPNQSQFVRNHPYNELIEKLVSMGFRGDHVASVIQRMEESGQAIDFNSVLDRLNVHGSVGPQRGWSG
ncbi:trithorax group protein osa isoform X2 [Cajanus cajan]|uniref:trithorax group protein osa isoform X2 n=1 Tax=Cajanus cajan TaxID=3821 RepID=UPI00098DC564|nr:trithorax group protein osa isoform X2 [Cajanus cajan]